MKRLSPSAFRIYMRLYLTANILWVAWLLPDTNGWQLVTGLVILGGLVASLIGMEVSYRRQRAENRIQMNASD